MSEQKDICDFIEAVKEAARWAECLQAEWDSRGHMGIMHYKNLANRLRAGLERLIEGALGPEDARLVRETCLASLATHIKRKEAEAMRPTLANAEPVTIKKKRLRERMTDADGS